MWAPDPTPRQGVGSDQAGASVAIRCNKTFDLLLQTPYNGITQREYCMNVQDLELLAKADALDHLQATCFEGSWTLDAVLRTGDSRTLTTARKGVRTFASLDTLAGVVSGLSLFKGLELRIRL